MPAPLAGVKVVDMGRFVAAPMCAMILGDLGADVIKVEAAPDGDMLRPMTPSYAPGIGAYFGTVNRNKRSITLALRSAGGQKVLRALARDADVLIENFRPGVLEAMGFSDDAIARDYPRLIAVRISAYGDIGPLAQQSGVDQMVQGLSGLMAVTGTAETGPIRSGIAISDVMCGLVASIAALGALQERTRSGRGQVVRTSLLQAMLAMMSVQAGKYLATGQDPAPEGNHHPTAAPYGLFATADGSIQIQVSRDEDFATFARLCDHPEWSADPRFTDRGSRSRHRFVLRELVTEALRRRTTAQWFEALTTAGIPCGPVLTVAEAFNHPQAQALGMRMATTLGDGTAIEVPGFAFRFSRTEPVLNYPPPMAGEHNAQILQELGLADDPEAQAALGG
jgi:crotonobetainyl-CoA:carnitine CoA-transferase CaiB-like acyl-CoA transferase